MPQISSIDSIKSLLISAGYEIKEISSNKVAVLTEENRIDVLKQINKKIKGSVYDKTPSSESSVGRIKIGKFIVLAKPAGKQGKASAGVGNEDFLVQTVNAILRKMGKINVVFKSGAKTYKISNCESVSSVGTDTSGRKKADVVFCSKMKKYPVSIKKDDAEIWESADSYFSEEARDIINAAVKSKKTKLVSHGSFFTIEPNVAVKASKKEREDVVFGSDLANNGAIITKTFSKSDFQLNGETLYISVNHIITELVEVKGDKDVYFLIRNDKTRKSIQEYPGIRILAVYKSRINKNVIVVDR